MQELKLQNAPATGAVVKRASLFVRSRNYHLTGAWDWDFHADALFCSDVMTAAPDHFVGARGLIHPDDLPDLLEHLADFPHVQFISPVFRIITTYGEIKTVRGKFIRQAGEDLVPPEPDDALERKTISLVEQQREAEHLQIRKEIWDGAERLQDFGTFYFNANTGKGWFSDQVFRLHGLPPQSLNAHLNTFSSFVHPEDSEMVRDAFDKAYRAQVPLHLQYRITTPGGAEKYLKLVTRWIHSAKGDPMLSGIIRDETEEKLYAENEERLQYEISFQKQMVHLDEQSAQLGHWYMNLLTRKMVFSDNCYRIHGLKHRPPVSGINTFSNCIHPDDRNRVLAAYRNMVKEHQLPEMEYRIIRPDGKTRYLKQTGKSIIHFGEIVIYGILQDISAEKTIALKLDEITREHSVRQFALAQAEKVALTGNWLFDLHEQSHTWSEGFYGLLGLKPQSAEPSISMFMKQVFPEDRKKLRAEMDEAMQSGKESLFDFRLMRLGSLRHIHASFRTIIYEERDFFMATLQDQTVAKTTEEQLQEKMQLAEALTENVFDRIFITDASNSIVFWSRASEELFALTREEVLGKNYFDVLPQFKTEQVLGDFAKVFKKERIHYLAAWSAQYREYQEQYMIPLQDQQEEVFGILHINRNVTRETELQRSLGERLKFIESLVESSVDRVIVLDRNMNYQYWNRRAEEYYGISKSEVLNKNIMEVFPSFVNDPSYQEFRRVLKGETVHISAQENLEKKKGYFETYLTPVKDEAGKVIAVLWVTHNLYSEYQLLQQLRKANYILDSINEIHMELDGEGLLRYVNRKGEETWKQEKPLVGKSIWDLLPEEKESSLRTGLQACLEHKRKLRGEFFATALRRWVYISAIPGEHGLIILLYDIHEARQATEQLANEHRRLKEAQAIGQVGSFEWEAATDQVFWSDEMYRIHGLEPRSEEITLAQVFAFVHPDDREGVREKVKECMKSGGSFSITHRLIRKDGQLRMVKRKFQSHDDEQGKVTHISGTVHDITEQKTTEEKIAKHLNILQQTENLARIGSWEYDPETGDLIWSDGMYRLFGLEAGARITPNIYRDLAIGEDKSVAKRIVNQIKKGAPFEEQLRIQKEGVLIVLKIKATVHTTDDGHPLKLYGVDLDITEASRSEEEIRKGRHLLEQMAKASPDSITIYDLEQKLPFYLNNCLAEWTGISPDELVAMGVQGRLSLIHPDDRLPLLHFNEKMTMANDGDVLTIEYRIRSARGDYRWIRNRSKIFERNEKGKVTKMLSVLQDHTREVELRTQLQQRTQYAESVIDASIDRIMVMDRDHRIIAWNRRSEEMTGIGKQQALGKKFGDLFPKVYEAEPLKKAIDDCLSGTPVFLPAIKGIYTNSYYERFYIPLKNERQETYALLLLMHDVSDLVSRNEALRQLNETLSAKNNELEQKNEEITQFAFVASHDLKEPLRKISTFASMLQDQEDISPSGESCIERISNAVKRMDLLIADIMVLTKIHADRARDEETDLNLVLGLVKEDLKEVLEESRGTIIADALPVIRGNKTQLFYLLKNLLSNAVKFQPPGRNPLIHISLEEVGGSEVPHSLASPESEYLKLTVADNGIGFDNLHSKKIFQVFQRLHGRQEYTGTGMGLAICKKIMDNHQGFITAEGEPGEGAVFICYFPV